MKARWIIVAGLCLALARPLVAQSGTAPGKTVYEADFFKAYSPSNALQMIERLPGFTLDAGATEVRGFGQAAGNVVINGQRPSSKSDGLSSILSRIPASRVARIEIASGNEFGSDFVGKPQVANVVLTQAGGLAGNVEGRLDREYWGRILPRVAASAILRKSASTFTASFTYQTFSLSEEGFDQLFDLPSMREAEHRNVVNRNTEPYTTASFGWGLEEAADRNIHLNGKVSWDKWTIDQNSDISQSGAHVQDGRYTEDHLWRTWEVSGDVTRPLAGGAIKLNALATHRHRRNDDALSQVALAGPLGGFYQKFDDWKDERVARLAWSHPSLLGWSAELGAEGAYNRLESDLNLFGIDGQGARTPISLPIDDALVEEYRGEAFVNAGRSLARTLRLDLGVAYEASRLTVTGDATARRTLTYLRPKASIDWTPGKWHAQLGLKRTVAQLNFGDFVSAASLNDNQTNGGNAEIVPQRAWELLFSADRKILGDGRVKIELGHNWITQVQDRVPTTGGLDAPGNLGDGETWIARSNLDLPLSRAGLRGMRLSLYGSYVNTSVKDPYTLRDRAFSGNSLFYYTGELRQDLGRFAWSVSMTGNTGATYFRLNETDTSQGISPNIVAFVEYRPSRRTTITFGIENLLNSPSKRWRYFYQPDRTATTPFQLEYRERASHRGGYLSVKHSFRLERAVPQFRRSSFSLSAWPQRHCPFAATIMA